MTVHAESSNSSDAASMKAADTNGSTDEASMNHEYSNAGKITSTVA
jgi:hypothetical protein